MIILLTGILTENFVLSKFLGICPFLGVSKKLDSSIGMGAAVTFVMVCASLVTYPIYYGILVPLGIEYMNTIAFILVIAVFVQLVEMVLKNICRRFISRSACIFPLSPQTVPYSVLHCSTLQKTMTF